jgi:hypothetical protein
MSVNVTSIVIRCRSAPKLEALQRSRPDDDTQVLALVLSKSQDGRDHDRSGAKPRFMDCNRGQRPDLDLAPTWSLRRCPRNYRQRRSFRLGDRRDLARGQSVSPLSWGSRVMLRARDNLSLDSLRSFLKLPRILF